MYQVCGAASRHRVLLDCRQLFRNVHMQLSQMDKNFNGVPFTQSAVSRLT